MNHNQLEHYLNNMIDEQIKYRDKMIPRNGLKHRKIFFEKLFKWISIKDRLPDTHREVLVFVKDEDLAFVGYYTHEWNKKRYIYIIKWNVNKSFVCVESGENLEDLLSQDEVTHWMELPDAP